MPCFFIAIINSHLYIYFFSSFSILIFLSQTFFWNNYQFSVTCFPYSFMKWLNCFILNSPPLLFLFSNAFYTKNIQFSTTFLFSTISLYKINRQTYANNFYRYLSTFKSINESVLSLTSCIDSNSLVNFMHF